MELVAKTKWPREARQPDITTLDIKIRKWEHTNLLPPFPYTNSNLFVRIGGHLTSSPGWVTDTGIRISLLIDNIFEYLQNCSLTSVCHFDIDISLTIIFIDYLLCSRTVQFLIGHSHFREWPSFPYNIYFLATVDFHSSNSKSLLYTVLWMFRSDNSWCWKAFIFLPFKNCLQILRNQIYQ